MAEFKTVRFGVLEYDESGVITLPDGLVGMTNLRRWLLLDMGDGLPMKWLQSLDRGDFGVPVMAPDFFTETFEVPLTPATRAALANQDPADLVTLVITTVHPGGTKVTANLRAPLILDAETRRGAQLTLDDDRYAIRQEIDYFKFGLAVKADTTENDNQEETAASAENPATIAASL